MINVYLMAAGPTVWEQQSRVESTVGAPLAEDGVARADWIVQQLADRNISAIYTSDGEAERQSAKLASRKLGAKVYTRRQLRELDFGLWQGLTQAELQDRHARQYRLWRDEPDSFRPPKGESPEEAQNRLRSVLREIARRHRGGPVLLVLRPIALALVRRLIEERGSEKLWNVVNPDYTWGSYEVDASTL